MSDTARVTVLIDCGCSISCLPANSSSLASHSASQDTVDLDLLRRFRDEVLQPTEVGSSFVDIYYNSTPEIATILILDQPDLGFQAVRMVEMMQPALRSVLDGDGSEVFTQALIDTIGNFFANLSAAGSDSLQQLIAGELARVGPLNNFVGLAIKDVINIALEDSVITTVRDNSQTVPTGFLLEQNYPNPFNPETEIRFQLPQTGQVTISIYNTLGQEIRKLADSSYEAGFHSVRWDGKDNSGTPVSSGLYLYKMTAGKFSQVKKMSLSQ